MVRYNYYYDKNIREICHEIKKNNLECCEIMANYFLNQEIIKEGDILIPIPQHNGYSIYTKQIAQLISLQTNAIVEDIIKSKPRETLYELKKQNKKVSLDFFLAKNLKEIKSNVFLIDNVLDTGQTFFTCRNLLNGINIIPLVYAYTNKNILENL